MSKSEATYWEGASGRLYKYFIHELPTSFSENQEGNYIFCKKDYLGIWVPVYIGQGDLSRRISENHHKIRCIGERGATHVHVHLNEVEEIRVAEEKDLLDKHSEAYQPIGCNEKKGR